MLMLPLDVGAASRVPVVVVPGILGSWNWGLFVGQGLEDAWEFPFGDQTYEPLLKSFEDEGYVRGHDLFVAFYDWRQSNADNYQQYLLPVIDEALLQNPDVDWVDVIAHSMGGLFTRAYVQSDDYRDDIRNFIMLATPNFGSLDAYYMWGGGDFPPDYNGKDKQLASIFMFYRGLTYSPPIYNRRELIHRDIPSVAELLPTFDYLVDVGTGLDLPVAGMQDQNPLLPYLNATADRGVPELEENVMQLTIFAGRGRDTMQRIAVEPALLGAAWPDGKPIDGAIAYNQTGDGTVLGNSVLLPLIRPNFDCFPDEPPVLAWLIKSAHACDLVRLEYGAETIAGWDRSIQRYIDDAGHRDIVTKAIPKVHEIIDSSVFDIGPHQSSEDLEESLAFLIASPVEPTITTPSGKKLSPTENQIGDNAEVYTAGDETGPKVLVINNPEAGTYQFSGTGTGTGGEYHVGVMRLTSGQPNPIGADENGIVPTIAGTILPGETKQLEVETLGQGLVVDGVVYGELPILGPAAGPQQRIVQLRSRVAELVDLGAIKQSFGDILLRSYESRLRQLGAADDYRQKGNDFYADLTRAQTRQQIIAQRSYVTYMERLRQITPEARDEILDLMQIIADGLSG